MGRPDFIGVGLQKGGTRWLYSQLASHPDVWMPPLKEFHFFDEAFPSAKGLAQLRKRPQPPGAATEFLARVEALAPSRSHPLATYFSLFDMAGGRRTGEITPGYSILTAERIAELARGMPGTRVILMLRDPVDRAWSFLNDAVNDGHLDAAAVTDPAAMRRALAADAVRLRSFPSQIHARWSASFPVLAPFFEDVVARPAELREEIVAFIGGRPGLAWGTDPSSNPKAGRARAPRTPAIREALVEHFHDEILTCAEVFGGPAEAWPAKHGLA